VKKNKTFGKLNGQEQGSEGSKLRDIVAAVHFYIVYGFLDDKSVFREPGAEEHSGVDW
jgi:hypothetical protein